MLTYQNLNITGHTNTSTNTNTYIIKNIPADLSKRNFYRHQRTEQQTTSLCLDIKCIFCILLPDCVELSREFVQIQDKSVAETIPLLSTNESEGGGDNNRRPTNRKRGYNAGKYKQTQTYTNQNTNKWEIISITWRMHQYNSEGDKMPIFTFEMRSRFCFLQSRSSRREREFFT